MSRLACIALLLISSAAIATEPTVDPMVIFARAKERLLADLARMPRYTCVQTVTRTNYPPLLHWHSPKSCAEVVAEGEKQHHPKPQSWDRLRLDVAVGDQGEIYSWVGAPRFDEGTLAQLAGNGTLGSGDFGPFVGAIFKIAAVKFQKEQVINGRHVLEYSYHVPESVSKYQILDNRHKNFFITAYSGTFFLDRDNPDLVQLTVRTADLPPETGKCQAINEAEYGRVPIHGSQVLIPQETTLRVIGRAGEEALNLTSYTNCREYSSKSVLRFDAPEPSESGTAKPPSAVVPDAFPPGLDFQWRVVTPIDSDTAAAGDPIEAVLRSPIGDNGAVLAPAGAHIHGRLVQFSHFGGSFELALKFESIEVKGATVPFSAALASDDKWSSARLHAAKPTELVSGAARFLFQSHHLKLTKVDSSGRTASPNPGKQ